MRSTVVGYHDWFASIFAVSVAAAGPDSTSVELAVVVAAVVVEFEIFAMAQIYLKASHRFALELAVSVLWS